MAWIWTALTGILFLYVIQELLTQIFKKKKKQPPSPNGLPILGHLHLIGKNPHQDLNRLSQKHGPIMYIRFGSVPTYVLSSPAGAELILKTHDAVFASRPPHEASKYICHEQRNITFGRYGPYWRDMRKLCTLELLSGHKISQFQAMRKSEIGLFVLSLKESAEKHETVDVSKRVAGLSADMVCLMVFGRKYEDKDFDENGFKAVVTETLELGAVLNLGEYFPVLGLLDVQGLTRRMKRLGKIFDVFLEKIIDDHVEKKQEKKQTLDFVDTMMGIMASGKAGFEFDRRHVKAVLVDMIVAGMDTSATVIEWAMSELIRHPQVMKKLQKELETVVGLDHMVEESHLESLGYLEMVVKETMRIHPVAPLLLPHESMEDCVIDGYHIPKNSRVIVNTYAIGRDPKVWPNPEKFSPDRFLDNNVDMKGRDFRLLPFGSGRRGCPGMQLGLIVVRLVIAQLVHCFDWELPDGMLASDLDMEDHFGSVTCRNTHLLANPTYRLQK
ncbi:cytochrome P450 71AU50-like [Henckelia pumila]|uniref:cytochrome P450 71AU50-like n=1 Tax=Henckelia pumila TaxID=405737 RepID=UPI003C6EA413